MEMRSTILLNSLYSLLCVHPQPFCIRVKMIDTFPPNSLIPSQEKSVRVCSVEGRWKLLPCSELVLSILIWSTSFSPFQSTAITSFPTVRDPMQPITPAGLREEAAVSAARKRRTKTTERGRKGASAFSGQRRAGPAGTGAGSWPGTSAGCPRRGGAGRGIPRVGSAAPIGCRPPRPGEAGPGRAGPGRADLPRSARRRRRASPGACAAGGGGAGSGRCRRAAA